MIYLLSGNQYILLKNRMKKIIKEQIGEIDTMNFVKMDASFTLVQEIVDEALFLPLGYDKKAVAVDNCYFLLKEKTRNKIESDQDYKKLINFIEHPDDTCVVLFLVNTSNSGINTKNPVYQAIEKHGEIINIDDPKDEEWHKVVALYFKEKWPNVTIDNDAVYELARRTDRDYVSLHNNGSKLALYTDHIRFDDVCLMVTRPLEEKAYLLVNYLIDNKNMDAVALFRDLKTNNVEPVTLINMMANEFRLYSNISYLAEKGYNNEQIAQELGIKNPARVGAIKRNIMRISKKRIKQTLEDLYTLDLQIKSGLVDRYYSFELFLINFKRN